METRGAYTLIGSFVVLGFICLFAVGIWFTGYQDDDNSAHYIIYIEESVSGLEIGSNVKYRGINAGLVKEMGINPNNPLQVQILAEIQQQFPIRVGDVAVLSLEGITGNAVINISGASADDALLKSSNADPAVIPSRISDIERLFTGTPELITEAVVLVQRVADLFNDSNRQVVGRILQDIEALTEMFSDNRQELDSLVATMNAVAADIRIMSEGLNDVKDNANQMLTDTRTTLNNINQLVSNDGKALIHEWQKTAKSLNRIADNADGLLTNNKDAINDFTTQGLAELTSFLHEGRILVSGLSRILDKLESSGARFLLNNQAAEYTPN